MRVLRILLPCLALMPILGVACFGGADDNCQPVFPSAELPFQKSPQSSSGKPSNGGVTVPGFIHFTGDLATVDGIGVSKYQNNVDFVRAKTCGATFAFVRVSGGTDPGNETTYKEHWRNAKSVGLLVAPYHNLSFLPHGAREMLRLTGQAREAKLRDLLAIASASHVQSTIFLTALMELLETDPVQNWGSLTGRLFLDPVLDLSYDPLLNSTQEERAMYAPMVQALACNFVTQVKSDTRARISRVLVFVTPDVWRGYHLSESSCHLGNDGIILSFMPRDGGTVARNVAFGDVCGTDGANRCYFDHYTSYASFLDFNNDKAVTLLRFYGDSSKLREHVNALQ